MICFINSLKREQFLSINEPFQWNSLPKFVKYVPIAHKVNSVQEACAKCFAVHKWFYIFCFFLFQLYKIIDDLEYVAANLNGSAPGNRVNPEHL